jgi:hypothetical protein
MPDFLYLTNLVTLKRICKNLHIKNYSNLRKNEIISLIEKHHSLIKIQRWIRKIFSKEEPCPISCEPIKYPCFAYKTPSSVFIYYNLDALRSFLIKTGDFRDPSTRGEYSEKQLLEMDIIHKYYHTVLHIEKNENENNSDCNEYPNKKLSNKVKNENFKSVFRASKNKKFYEKIKEKEQEQLIFERILDSICDEMVKFIGDHKNDNQFTLDSVYLYDYRTQFRRLINRSKTHAEYVINKNIDSFNQVYTKEKDYNNNQCKSCEYVVINLYQMREELYIDS